MERNQFLKKFYKFCEGQKVELRALPSKHREFFALDDFTGIEAFCRKHSRGNVYFAVATRNGGGTKEHIQEIPSVWVGIDFKVKDTSQETATKRLNEFPLKSSFVISSGGGYHVYWQFKEPATKAEIPEVEYLNRQLAVYFDGDMAATDASRILRLPDTKNFKYKPPRPVKIISHHDVKYDPSDFEFLPALECDPQGSTLYNMYTSSSNKERDTFPGDPGQQRDKAGQPGQTIEFTEGHRDNTLFHLANYLVKSGMPLQHIETYLYFFGKNCKPSFPEKEISSKIKSAFKRVERQNQTLAAEFREWVSGTHGWWNGTERDKELGNGTKRDREYLRKLTTRLVDKGVLERHTHKNGLFRRIEEAEEIDFLNAETKIFDIKWPFQVEQLVEVMPGNLIVVAGEIEAGKTAFLLNVARFNMDRSNVYYFSSEMGASELRKRLSKFDHMVLSQWKGLKAEACAGDFHDVIRPNAVNIIDFIEVHDEFYKVGAYLKRIHDKLNNGIAVVAIQKNPGRDEGLGGQRSMEVARLYLSMSKDYPGGRLKIVKGKNWATDRNPNGLSMKYKIVNGCQLIPQGDWHRDIA